MSNRYSIDYPDSDQEGEDIVLGGEEVSPQDRELLRIDDEVVEALKGDGHASNGSPKIAHFKNFLPGKKKIKFTKLSNNGPSGGIEAREQGYHQVNNNKSSPLEELGVGDEDDFSDTDIEIDLEMHPIRRRQHNKSFIQKLHLLLLTSFILLGLFVLSNIMKGGNNNKNKDANDRPFVKKPIVSNGTHEFHPTTLVVSLDGFHPHYVNEKLTPNLHDLFTRHSSFPYMTPSFPSSTFPNHWTLVTGLHPINHGIVGNTFYDPGLDLHFVNSDRDHSLDRRFWGGEPIWQTAAIQGVSSAIHMWPGSEVHFEGAGPLRVDVFNGTELLENKRDRVFEWIDQDDIRERPELILAYVPDVDTLGHKYGIAGSEIRNVLTKVDTLIGDFLKGIKDRNLQDIMNLIVVSDHGMAPTSNERLVYMEDIIDTSKVEYFDGWPLAALRPFDKADVDTLYNELRSSMTSSKPYQVFKPNDMPKEWFFGGVDSQYSDRLADIWVVPKIGWSLTTRKDLESMGNVYKPFGVHGYNNSETLMRALFLASGPSFKHKQYSPISNVDFYNILCQILGIKPSKNDGAPLSESLRVLPQGWTDPRPYPGVEFHTEILKVNSTYDELFSSSEENVIDNQKENSEQNPSQSLKSDVNFPTPTVLSPSSSSLSPSASSSPSSSSSSTSSKLLGWLESVGNAVSDSFDTVKDWLHDKLSGN